MVCECVCVCECVYVRSVLRHDDKDDKISWESLHQHASRDEARIAHSRRTRSQSHLMVEVTAGIKDHYGNDNQSEIGYTTRHTHTHTQHMKSQFTRIYVHVRRSRYFTAS